MEARQSLFDEPLPAHSSTGASSMSRWAMCPGSVREAAKMPPAPPSDYAKDGILAHDLAKIWLTTGREPVFPSDEMRAAVKVYVDRIHGFRVKDEDGVEVFIEQKFHLPSIHPNCFGTADGVIWRPARRVLHVDDFKYGEGVLVMPKQNPQLMYYALGAMLTFDHPVAQVELTVVQPRIDHPDGPIRSWTLDKIDLLDFAVDLKRYIQATEDPAAPLVPGSHCHFCPAAAICPALHAEAQALAKLEFTMTDIPATLRSYDPAQLSRLLDAREFLKTFLKAIDEFAYAEAEAGRCPPGYKLVAKRASRKWKDEDATLACFKKIGMSPSEYLKPAVLLSPPQIEDTGLKLDPHFTDLYEKVSSGHALAPLSDPRPSVRIAAKDDFTVIDTTCRTLFEEGEPNGKAGPRQRDLLE